MSLQTKQEAVFNALRLEREYQNKKWAGKFDDSKWSISDWLIFMERYIQRAKDRIGIPKDAKANNPLHEIRKIGALAVACMEHLGIPTREQEQNTKRWKEGK